MMSKATGFAALICATATAHAAGEKYDEHGFQMGAAFGRSAVSITADDLDGSSSANNFGYKLFAGYRFNQYVAIEGSWEDSQALEDSDDGGTPPNVSIDDDVSLRVKPKTYGASVVGSLPFGGSFTAFARAGISKWEADLTSTLGASSASIDDSGSDLKWGIGITTRLDGALVRLEYEQMQVEFDAIPELPLDLQFRQLTLGVVWLF